MTELLKGKPVADAIKADISKRVCALEAKGIVPSLAIVRVGNRPDDVAYESSLIKAAHALGINVELFGFDTDVTQEKLLECIRSINADPSMYGCLMFRPLPKGLDETAAANALDAAKDVDGMGAASLAGVFMGIDEGFAPATAEACMQICSHYGIALEGKRVAVLGRSLVIGKPVAMLMLKENATVTICHSKTKDAQEIVRSADIAVCATGLAKVFGDGYFAPGQTVLDVGMNTDADGSLCGDADASALAGTVGAYTPVPGGVGSVTTAVLMEHVVRATERACPESD